MTPTEFSTALLKWYDKQRRRHLPWREQPDPYRIWVSEIMLQQTQVETVIPYFERFMAAFEDVRALAGADEGQVLKLWEGLGYYSRARNLHQAAKEVVARYGGQLPDDGRDLATLPGIGPYTRGAVLSIAFGQRVAAVDGNVLRVMARFEGNQEDLSRSPVRRALSERAEELVDEERPGDFNQALMELGALICRPRSPQCGECPLAAGCRAFASGDDPETYGRKGPRREIPTHHWVCGIVSYGGRTLVCRRVSKGLLGGLWEFPAGLIAADESDPAGALQRVLRERLGIAGSVGQQSATLEHVFSHQRWRVQAYTFAGQDDKISISPPKRPHEPEWQEVAWCSAEALVKLAFSTVHKRLAAELRPKLALKYG